MPDLPADAGLADVRCRAVLEALPVAVLVVRDGRVQYANRTARMVFASPADGADPTALSTWLRDTVVQPVTALVAEAVAGARPETMLDVEGRQWVVSVSPLADSTPTEVAVVFTDVGGAREAERRRSDAASARDRILALVSHELRSPLNGIQSWSHVIDNQLDRMQDVPPLMSRALDGIRAGIDQQVRLIEQLNAMSSVLVGDLRFAMSAVDLGRIVDGTVEDWRPDAIAKDVVVEVSRGLDGDLLRGDPHRLQQVVHELLANALKFTPPGGRIVVSTARRDDRLLFSVRDSGRGLDPGFETWLFEPFRQGDDPNVRRTGGLGLGLALAQRIAERHGGAVVAESAGAGHGALFTLSLPRLVPEAASGPAPSTTGVPTGHELDGVHALVIDDQIEAREALSSLLGQFGASVSVAASSRDGIAVIDADRPRPDVVICDIAMPDEDGYGFVRRLRAYESRPEHARAATPVVALSAFVTSAGRAGEPRFDYYLSKPVNPQLLLATLSKATGRAMVQGA